MEGTPDPSARHCSPRERFTRSWSSRWPWCCGAPHPATVNNQACDQVNSTNGGGLEFEGVGTQRTRSFTGFTQSNGSFTVARAAAAPANSSVNLAA